MDAKGRPELQETTLDSVPLNPNSTSFDMCLACAEFLTRVFSKKLSNRDLVEKLPRFSNSLIKVSSTIVLYRHCMDIRI